MGRYKIMDEKIEELSREIENLEKQFEIFQQEMLDLIDNLTDTIMPDE